MINPLIVPAVPWLTSVRINQAHVSSRGKAQRWRRFTRFFDFPWETSTRGFSQSTWTKVMGHLQEVEKNGQNCGNRPPVQGYLWPSISTSIGMRPSAVQFAESRFCLRHAMYAWIVLRVGAVWQLRSFSNWRWLAVKNRKTSVGCWCPHFCPNDTWNKIGKKRKYMVTFWTQLTFTNINSWFINKRLVAPRPLKMVSYG